MYEVILKRFDSPDEVRTFEKGKFELLKVGDMTIGRTTYEPGWKWSVHVGKAAGAKSCAVEHVGMVVSGRATAAMDDGRVIIRETIAWGVFALVAMLGVSQPARAQETKAPYPSMAPLEQYLMEKNAEIVLARSAAPESISQDAEVMVLGRHGYETAVKGKNGFVCMVWRSWAGGSDFPEFWNPKLRAPICFNPPAAHFNLPLTAKRTELILAGRSQAQVFEVMKAAYDKQELPPLEPGAMCYMLSKQGYLSDADPHWHPHLMFFIPLTETGTWGAGLPGSPVVVAFTDPQEQVTTFLVPVPKWSDGTLAPEDGH